MFKLNSRHKSLLGLGLIFTATSFACLSTNVNPVSGQIIAEQSNAKNESIWRRKKIVLGSRWSIWRRKPKRPMGARSGNSQICAIAPGLIDTYIVWNNRPLFLWEYSGENKQVDLIVREFDSKKDVWKQAVNLADKKAFYDAEKSLEPGKIYQWQLSGNTNWSLFKIMPADERDNVQKQLQALEEQSKNTKNYPEEIALKKVDFFLNYEIKHQAENETFNAWSDALLALHQVENPSPDFVNNRKKLVESLCTPRSNVSKK